MSAHDLEPTVAPASRDPRRPGPRRDGGGRRRWTIAVFVTVVAHLGALLLLGIPMPDIEERPAASSRLAWTGRSTGGGGSVLAEQLLLFDNAPLFLPTAWNSAAAENVMTSGRSPAEIFEAYPPRLTVAEGGIPAMLPVLPEGVDSVLGGLAIVRWNTWSEFGRVDREPVRVTDRLALIEVHSFTTGEVVLTRAISRGAAENAEAWPDWTPFEMLVEVDRAGTSAPPLLVPRGSGSEVVDSFFQSIVVRELRLDVRFGPGYYRLVIGP